MTPRSYLRLVPDGVDPAEFLADTPEIGLTIDCDLCVAQHTDACDDCVVSYLVGHEEGTPVVLDSDERRAVELLAEAGLVPASRFSPRPGVA